MILTKPIKLVVVAGPTASGKTALAVQLAHKLNGEVVSADSMQIYREMNIATAKPTVEEQEGIPHHLLDFLEPQESFSVARYTELAHRAIADIVSRGKQPILAGGTGLYLNAVTQNLQFLERGEGNPDLRNALLKQAQEEGTQVLLERLSKVDPQTAARLHPNDKVRIVRALELYETTGETISQQNAASRQQASPYDLRYIGLRFEDRQELYDRINRRVDMMLEAGLEEEARQFFASYHGKTAVQAIGYKELKPYFDGACPLDEAVEILKRETRRYAKRQLTWLRRVKGIHWLAVDRFSKEELLKQALLIANS